MIQKKIHYVWVGGNEKPNNIKDYIKTFKKIYTNWEIKEWNESNIPNSKYLINAIKNKKWSNVSNYIRLYALITEGGIYLDTDIELIKEFDSELINSDLFLGFESNYWCNSAVLGATKGNSFLIEALIEYELLFDGVEESNLSGPRFITNYLRKYDKLIYSDNIQTIKILDSTVKILPKRYFYPYNYNEHFLPSCIKTDTVCVHHWTKLW